VEEAATALGRKPRILSLIWHCKDAHGVEVPPMAVAVRVIAIEPNAETIAVINRRANSSAVLCKISSLHRASTERSSALSPFHEICTPMHTRMKDDKRIKIFIAASPSASAIRSAKR